MIRRYFIANILLWVPIWATWMIVRFLVNTMDRTLELIPKAYRPEALLGFHIPGLGLLFTIIVIFFTGMLVTNLIGKKLLNWWHQLIDRIPLVRSIYNGVREVLHTLFESQTTTFRKVVMLEYPRKGIWSVAFLVKDSFKQANDVAQEDLVTVFIPTTPNPTSGFWMMVPRKDIVELDLTIDQALKLVISLGVVAPCEKAEPAKVVQEVAKPSSKQ